MKRMGTQLFYVIIGLLLVAFSVEGVMYLGLKARLDSLEPEYERVKQQYATINATVSQLTSNLTSMARQYESARAELSELEVRYQSLSNQYSRMATSYNDLSEKYNQLASIIDRPLKYPQVPTLDDLNTWLSQDDTDLFEYSEDFNCLDFSLSLSTRARSMGWKMGVLYVHGYDNITLAKYAHAFNSINTSEGIIYVEPMRDEVWWYEGHATITTGGVFLIAGKPIMVEDILIIVTTT